MNGGGVTPPPTPPTPQDPTLLPILPTDGSGLGLALVTFEVNGYTNVLVSFYKENNTLYETVMYVGEKPVVYDEELKQFKNVDSLGTNYSNVMLSAAGLENTYTTQSHHSLEDFPDWDDIAYQVVVQS